VAQRFAAAPPQPDARDIDRALALLEAAERPIVIAGSGIWWARAEEELRRFLEQASLPLYTITMARGLLPDDHPLVMAYADPAMCRTVLDAFREADLFLILGKRLDYRLALGGPRLFPPEAKFIQVDIHPQELGMNRRLELGICADVKATLQALLAGLGSGTWRPTPWLDRLRALRRQWEEYLAGLAQDRSSPIHPVAFFAELKKALPPGTLYSWDGANFPHWGRASMPALIPGGWVRLGPLGTIGAGLPNALALQLANPGQPVALVTGDGSLGFYIIELDTAVRHRLPVVFIVGNDGCWGLERDLQLAAPGVERTVACDLRHTRYDLVMKGFGGGGETIETLDQVRPAVERAFASGRPYLLNVLIRGIPSPFVEWQIAGKR
jgi:acetolactate synthase-1/2/3 large subunit